MMIETISLLAILVAIIIGFARNINVGLISLVFAFFLGTYLGQLEARVIINYWPLNLFFTTFGITFLFAIAKINGTLEKISNIIIFQSRGSKFLIQVIFYFLALVIASIGPGNISTSALLLPIGMAIAHKSKMSLLTISTLIILGSIAGGLSPIAPNGIVALELAKINGVGELGISIYMLNVVSITTFALIFFASMRGFTANGEKIEIIPSQPLNQKQSLTMFSILVLIVWVIAFQVHVGFAAFVLAAILLVFEAADQKLAIANVPWSTILLVCGTAVLISVVNQLGGINLLTHFLASLMNESTAIPIMAILAGVMSIFSSAVGVVMPTLIPTTVNLSSELSGVVSPVALTITIALASHMTTMSPFSVMGALALASIPEGVNEKELFKNLFIVAFISLSFVAILLTLFHQMGLLS